MGKVSSDVKAFIYKLVHNRHFLNLLSDLVDEGNDENVSKGKIFITFSKSILFYPNGRVLTQRVENIFGSVSF